MSIVFGFRILLTIVRKLVAEKEREKIFSCKACGDDPIFYFFPYAMDQYALFLKCDYCIKVASDGGLSGSLGVYVAAERMKDVHGLGNLTKEFDLNSLPEKLSPLKMGLVHMWNKMHGNSGVRID